MPNRLGGNVKAIVGFLFGLALTIFGWYMVDGIAGISPTAMITALFWIGLFVVWGVGVFLTPFMMITKGVGEWKNSVKGILYFFGGYVSSVFSYYFIPVIIDALPLTDSVDKIGYFGLTMFWVIAILIIPIYHSTKSYIPRG